MKNCFKVLEEMASETGSRDEIIDAKKFAEILEIFNKGQQGKTNIVVDRCTYYWEISDFNMFGEYFYSTAFSLEKNSDLKWRLLIHQCSSENNQPFIKLYLQLHNKPTKKIAGQIFLMILNTDRKTWVRQSDFTILQNI